MDVQTICLSWRRVVFFIFLEGRGVYLESEFPFSHSGNKGPGRRTINTTVSYVTERHGELKGSKV